jgi:hypothetical protein
MSSKVECAGFTKSGTRCKRSAAVDSIYCWQHKEIAEEKKEIVKPVSPKKISPVSKKLFPDIRISGNSSECISSEQGCPLLITHKTDKSFLRTGKIPVNAVITDNNDDYEDNYLSDPKSNQNYGFGPFIVRAFMGKHKEILEDIMFVEDRDYTLREIIDRIIQFYSRPINKDYLGVLIEIDQISLDLYQALIAGEKRGEEVTLADANGDVVSIESFKQIKDNLYELVLGL